MKIINYTLFFSLLILTNWGLTQSSENIEFKRKNFKDDVEGFKKAVAQIDQGTPLFEEGSKAVFEIKEPGLNFKKAISYFQNAQKFNPNDALNNFRIGVCLYHSSSPYEAIPYIKRAHELDAACDPFLSYYLGCVQHLENDFAGAKESYQKFYDSYKKADDFSKFLSQKRRQTVDAPKLISSPVRAWVDNMEELNTEYDEIAPTITMDGSELIFSSNRPNGNHPNEVGEYDHDIYISYNDEGVWHKAKPIPGSVNTTLDDIVNNLDFDGSRMLLHKDNEGQIDLYESKLNGAKWGTPEILPIQISSKRTNDKYGAYSHNGYNITFARQIETQSKGSSIMFSEMQSKMNKDYKAAALIGAVSSQFNDGPIYLHIDGKTMYIASQGNESLGGYDIFISKKTGSGWSKPENMGYPINTPYDDFFFAATANGKYAYISSNRPGGKGGFDLYKVTFWGAPKQPIVDIEDQLLASVAEPIKDPQIEEVVSINKVSLTVFKGKTMDALTKKPVEAAIEITDNKTGRIIENFQSNSATGKFLLSLTAGKNYGIAVKADGYLFHSENFDIPDDSEYSLVNKIIELKNIAIGSKIALRNIFFDVGRSSLRSESNAELDRLVKLLKDVPSLKVELSGHTDNTGSASINDKLSQDRAKSVVDYLIGKGIASNRLTAVGYGSSRPVAGNNTASGRQENRRTEFEITGN